MIQFSVSMDTDLVTNATLNRIRRNNNERTGKDIVQYVIPSKFRRTAYSEFPGTVRPRSRNYARWKRNKVGHDIPNVLTGKLRESLKAEGEGVQITKTANSGKVRMRFYFAAAGRLKSNGQLVKTGARESQRQELEALNDRQRQMLVKRQEERFIQAINDPQNRRKRAVKRARK